MANIDISQDTLNETISYLIQNLRDSGFTGSTEAGTGIYDVLIRPYAMLRVMLVDEINRAKAYSSLTEAANLRSTIGEDEYTAAVDSILSNWFVTRKDGTKSTGTVRLYFTKTFSYLSIPKDGSVKLSINDVNYDVARDYVISTSDFSSIYNSDRNAIEYYTDINVESIDNISATAGTVVTNINSIYLLRAEVIGDISSGKEYETNEEFIARTQRVITTRELVSDNAIYTTLREVFSDIKELYVAGYGDPEQLRDIVEFSDIDIHVGNKSDIYLNIELNVTSANCYVNSYGVVDIQQTEAHVADIDSICHPFKTQGQLRLYCSAVPGATVTIAGNTQFYPVGDNKMAYTTETEVNILTTDWVECYNPGETGVYYILPVYSGTFATTGDVKFPEAGVSFLVPTSLVMLTSISVFSTFTNRSISFTKSHSTDYDIGTIGVYPTFAITEYVGEISSCIVKYLGNPTYTDVYNYVNDQNNRLVCYNPSLKSKFIIFLTCDIIISTVGLSTIEDIEAERVLCQNAIVTYINSLTKDDVFSVYDMLVAINDTCASIDRVKTPVSVTYSFQDPESLITYTGAITDSFSLDDVVLGEREVLSLMVSQNTFQYYTNESKVTVTVDKATY